MLTIFKSQWYSDNGISVKFNKDTTHNDSRSAVFWALHKNNVSRLANSIRFNETLVDCQWILYATVKPEKLFFEFHVEILLSISSYSFKDKY